MTQRTNTNRTKSGHGVTALAVLVIGMALAGCNGDDIHSLPEAQPLGPLYTIGNTTPLGSVGFGTGTLWGTPLTVSQSTVLRKFGIIAVTGGANYRMALYTDNAGLPFQLVSASASQLLLAGTQEVAATPNVPIGAGTYWILFTLDGTVNLGGTSSISTPNKYINFTYGTPLPATLTGVLQGAGNNFNQWIVVQD